MMGVLLFGFGRFGKEHLKAWAATGRAQVVAIVDPGYPEATAPGEGSQPPIPVVPDFDSIPSGISWDVAAVVTPVWSHRDIASLVIREKIPFLIEKPLAPTSQDALFVRNASVISGVFGMPGHIMRFSPPHVKIHSALATSGFPKVNATFRRDRSAALLDMYPGEHPALLTGIHDIDLACWFTGSPVARVSAEDHDREGRRVSFRASLTHENGSETTISGAYDAPVDTPDHVFDRIVIEDPSGPLLAEYSSEASSPGQVPESEDSPLVAEVSHFLDVVTGVVDTPIVTLEDAVHCLAVVEAIIESSRSKGDVVSVAPLGTTVQ